MTRRSIVTRRSIATPPFDRDAPFEPTAPRDPATPLQLDAGGRREYAVYHRAGSRDQAVKRGGSVAAVLLTLPWLLYRRLFGTALMYLLFGVAVSLGLAVTGLAWIDAGEAVDPATRAATVAFALLALLGMIIAPWRQANRWRREKLEKRGFSLIALVRANSTGAAFAAVERATSGSPARARSAAR